MIQTFDTQLEVSLRAMREVVAPALNDAESHVIEQFHLALITLEFMRERLPYARSFHRLELTHLLNFSEQVRGLVANDQPDLAAALDQTETTGHKDLARPEAEIEDYLIVGRKLREHIGEVIKLSNGKPYENELDKLALRSQKEFLPAQRAWCEPLGLDTRPDEVLKIEEVLAVS
ncbi:MAG: hypothetical protein ACI9DH_000060 [Halioglobus sp.]|jgi:hypothetical protein